MQRTRFKARLKEEPTGHPGRIGAWNDNMLIRVYQLCLLGLTDKQIAIAFGVNVTTIDNWKQNKPDFLKAMQEGKYPADGEVVHTMFQKATGYTRTEIQSIPNKVREYDEKGKVKKEYTEIIEISVEVYYPPDTVAGIFWLKNRQRAIWADVQRKEITGKDGQPIQIQNQVIDLSDVPDKMLTAMINEIKAISKK